MYVFAGLSLYFPIKNKALSQMSRLIFLIIFLVSFAFSCFPGGYDLDSTAQRIIKSSLSEKKGYGILRELCEIGPRLSGSENSLKAIYWAEKKMKDLGLDSVWLQPVMVPKWERGNNESAEIIYPKAKNKKLSVAALGGSVSTPEKGIIAEVIEISTYREAKELKNKLKGKIVFINHHFNEGFYDTFGGYNEAGGERFTGPVVCAYYGAAAVLIRSITTKYDNTPHVGVMGRSDTVKQIPAAAIGLIDADLLSAELKKNPSLKINLKLSCRTLPDAQSYNVIGEIRGSEKPDDVIVVGGHFDSWDVGEGAHDDGAGCIQALEVLDLFKRLDIKPKRTIRCVFFINEENGTRGGYQYNQYLLNSKENHIAAIESDRGAFTPRGFEAEGDSTLIPELQKYLPLLQKTGIEWIKPGFAGVDLYYIKNCRIKLGYVPDWQRYFDYHHSANDVFEAVNPREFQAGSAALALMTYILSEYL